MLCETAPRVVVFAFTLAVCVACGSSDENFTPTGDGGRAGSPAQVAGNAGSGAAGSDSGNAGTNQSGGSGGSNSTSPTIADCSVFTPDDAWNTAVADAPLDEEWTTRIRAFVAETRIHPDYGSDGDVLYGIPINVVPQTQALVPVAFDWYEDESDPGPYPFPGPELVKIEGGDATDCSGDCHVLVLQQGICKLYEGYACEHRSDGWHCGNGAVWDLKRNSYGQRTKGFTSADAAGLAITPGLLRYDEVRAGVVAHALRFTTRCTRDNFVRPATHKAVPDGCTSSDPNYENFPPMGLRVRLRRDFDISGFPESSRVILTALKTYGMILADNGSNFYFQGEAHPGWTEDDIEPLKAVSAAEFEVVQVPPLEN